MSTLGEVASHIRSKNAGPFWLTIDVFLPDAASFEKVCAQLSTDEVARRLGAAPASVRRFEIADLAVIKFSLPRPAVQGSVADRDMHGASFALLIGDIELEAG
ncbi:protein of unknown function [Meinhardsimonia xiamenensis]|jgi:hypothetical protein|uniref:DUF4387 domain-containing protein n=1 Tax=Meinhardsimonia xiamenensis TaxID=990712 RepID=A0A1G9A9N2_9RHOB|nr:DUF4387 family protein [Meinhardsimonia xiamenensis]PRX35506.1 uncharacterized protein DUF4387 [Meinhardsimonia xiamenensis]SDK23315.1 protein of unknown function [Meinhardsimonia xiamenensis]